MKLQCNQCGEIANVGAENKFCPVCGDSFTDEFKEYVRSEIKISEVVWAVAALILIGGLLLGFIYVDGQRHYTWEQQITSPITAKNLYTTTTYVPVGDPPVMVPITHIHREFYLQDGHCEQVSESEYGIYEVGGNYTYSITHREWKPGMEDAPTPQWVWQIPCGTFFFGIIIPAVTTIWIRRVRQVREFEKTGDTEID
jgi:hypothetical protein